MLAGLMQAGETATSHARAGIKYGLHRLCIQFRGKRKATTTVSLSTHKMSTLFVNGRIFQSGAGLDDDAVFHSAMVVKDGVVRHVGAEADAAVQDRKSVV